MKTLLTVRELREERAKERLSAARAAMEEARKDLETLLEFKSSLFSELSGRTFSGDELQLFGQGLEATFFELRRAEERLSSRIKEVEAMRKELEVAHRQRRVAERLSQRIRERIAREEEKAFYREMDDLTLMRRKGEEL